MNWLAGIFSTDNKKEDSIISGTKSGALKTAQTNLAKYGPDYYKRIGAKGGKNGTTGGFYANREVARNAGAKGGKISRVGHRFIETKDGYNIYQHIQTDKIVRFKVN